MSCHCYRVSPLIRYTLLGLYWALTLPLPFLLAQQNPEWSLITLLILGMLVGFVLLWGVLDQRVQVDAEKLTVSYPGWLPEFIQQGWSLKWPDVSELVMASTSQGGLVYYLSTDLGQRFLLPMRVEKFRHLLGQVQHFTGIETQTVYPYVQPWMYLILAGFTAILLLCDISVLGLVMTAP
ncbi:MAG: hypothetical protein HC921_08245 [Synechococcaceae cyanobacterium SM2_3_1]|nr:hypothetical protein [Synechococcaceae cyanobacterium SM2_3_1]